MGSYYLLTIAALLNNELIYLAIIGLLLLVNNKPYLLLF